ncbi:hypothetical protein FACS1894182_13730 [Bacteroidia bacterium]|nr:hypothetical protein FACS1894182_13730 [Bacteroidia bacterium]
MIAKYYGRSFTNQTLRERSFITRSGVSLLGISEAAESIHFRSLGVQIPYEQLKEVQLPCILHWNQKHFVVLYKIEKPFWSFAKTGKEIFYIADPAGEKYKMTKTELLHCWATSKKDNELSGVALLLEPTPNFYTQEDEEKEQRKLTFFLQYLAPHKSQLVQLLIGLIIGSLLALLFPFLTQSIVDQGIGNHNLGFITMILIAQLVLFCTQLSVEFIRNWISLHVNTRISISLISDFLSKLMKLPLRFF